MSDETRFASALPLSETRSRVAYDLMKFIGQEVEQGDKSSRDYWLRLYTQCYKAATGRSIKHVLEK